MAYNANTKLGELLDNAATKAILTKHLPRLISAGPMLVMGRGMSLQQIAGFPQAKVTPEKLQAIIADLEKL